MESTAKDLLIEQMKRLREVSDGDIRPAELESLSRALCEIARLLKGNTWMEPKEKGASGVMTGKEVRGGMAHPPAKGMAEKQILDGFVAKTTFVMEDLIKELQAAPEATHDTSGASEDSPVQPLELEPEHKQPQTPGNPGTSPKES